MEILRQTTNFYTNNKQERFDIKKIDNSQWNKQLKVIKFTGDIKQNIQQLLVGMQCKCGLKKDFHQIISAYGEKIIKLREQRGRYKENLTQEKLQNECLIQENNGLKKQLKNLQQSYYIVRKQSSSKSQYEKCLKQNNTLIKKLEQINYSKIQMQQANKQMQEEILRLTQQVFQLKKDTNFDKKTSKNDLSNQSYLLDDSRLLNFTEQIDLLQKQNQVLRLKLDKYQKIYRQFNLEHDQILKVLKEYVQQMPSFSTRQERQLYRIASKMNNNLWKKKLQIQIKDLQQKKQNLRKLQEQFNEKKLKNSCP